MLKRRSFIGSLGLAACSTLLSGRSYAIPVNGNTDKQKVRFGLITDLHHLQFGQDEQARMKGFMDAVIDQNPDFIIQNGDFCRHTKSDGIMAEWNRFKGPKYHVLGNHDMDFCDKATIMQFWGMKEPYYSFDQGGYHFVVMDRNYLRRDDGSLEDYNTSNWGPLPAPKRSFTDKNQLDWLREDLAKAMGPIIVFMHQPVFLSDFFEEIGNAGEILEIFDQCNLNAGKTGRQGKVAAVFMGHDHDDRYGRRNGVHYFIVNSATYVYTKGHAYFYKEPLYAFITLDPAGNLILEGRKTAYTKEVPDSVRARFPTVISDHKIDL
ncbi:metallophosphoesterase family protein [Dyadobacter frigoris]|uniref:metallophosphoesterase family protein n=1 Tax=Dyadobacter frigoris TaxID=2576211 RepID=UPI002557C4CB|nr:metallophosphoesterase [Dyadobacter frigoris]